MNRRKLLKVTEAGSTDQGMDLSLGSVKALDVDVIEDAKDMVLAAKGLKAVGGAK